MEATSQATVARKPGHRGEHDIGVKTIARGMPADSGVTVVTTLVCLFFYTRGYGRIERPAFPAPSEFQGRKAQTQLGRTAPRDREAVSVHGGLFEM